MKKNNLIFWLLVLAILGLLGWGATKLAGNDTTTGSNTDILKIQDNDQIKGSSQAKLVLIEYSDFQCPACKTAAFYGQLLETDSSNLAKDVAIIFRHFPLESIHPHAKLAAQATEAAGQQNKFWEMHNLLFDQQEIWSNSTNAEESFVNYAKDLGLDTDKFKIDLYSNATKNKVEQNIKEASKEQLDIQYTPTIYLNGEIINLPNSYDKFRQLLQSKLGQ